MLGTGTRVPGYPGPEPDEYPFSKIPESPSTILDTVSYCV